MIQRSARSPVRWGKSCASQSAHYLISGLYLEHRDGQRYRRDELIEIRPPETVSGFESAQTCLSCLRRCSLSEMDDDGCGICDECLSP